MSWNCVQFLRTTTCNMMIWEIFPGQGMSFGKLKQTLSYAYSFQDQQLQRGKCWNIQSTRLRGCIPPTNPWRLSSAWHTMLLFAFTTLVLDMLLQRILLTTCWFFMRPQTRMGLLFLKQRWSTSSRVSWLQLSYPVLPSLSIDHFVCIGLACGCNCDWFPILSWECTAVLHWALFQLRLSRMQEWTKRGWHAARSRWRAIPNVCCV